MVESENAHTDFDFHLDLVDWERKKHCCLSRYMQIFQISYNVLLQKGKSLAIFILAPDMSGNFPISFYLFVVFLEASGTFCNGLITNKM